MSAAPPPVIPFPTMGSGPVAPTLPRRGLAGFLGFVAAFPASAAPESPDAQLEAALAALQQAERDIDALPDDDPRYAGLIAHMDLVLVRAAMIRPLTDRGFAVKARIARIYGDSRAGAMVERMLLSDLMIRGRTPMPAPAGQEFLEDCRALPPEGRAALGRFFRRLVAGEPFDENLARMGREVDA